VTGPPPKPEASNSGLLPRKTRLCPLVPTASRSEGHYGYLRLMGAMMANVQGFSRITMNPDVMGGKPCIRGMRVTVGMIVEALAAGRTVAELLAASPYLDEQDIREALLSLLAWCRDTRSISPVDAHPDHHERDAALGTLFAGCGLLCGALGFNLASWPRSHLGLLPCSGHLQRSRYGVVGSVRPTRSGRIFGHSEDEFCPKPLEDESVNCHSR
jgi:uncharacterized protein (DUF433 family)